MSVLEVKNLTVSYGKEEVLKGLELSVEEGEFITILGPSGCGKTTLLKSIAGLVEVQGGEIYLNGKNVTKDKPETRNVNTIFQNYALFPLMTVRQNISYGLKIKKTPKHILEEKTNRMIELVELGGYENKFPNELSGGQQQRVAIARALIMEPKVLLLDEPLGALDADLRRRMQVELRELQKKLCITFIFITHDRDEAIAISDRIIVMSDGNILKQGTPSEVFNPVEIGEVSSLARIDFVLENGERMVFCKKGIDNCIERLQDIKKKMRDGNEK